VQVFVTSYIDYCNALSAAGRKVITDKLQRMLNAAARVLSETNQEIRPSASHWGLALCTEDALYKFTFSLHYYITLHHNINKYT